MIARDTHINEKNFIGALIRSPNSFWSINDVVDASMFNSSIYRDIFSSIRDIAERGRQVTMTTLQAHLPEEYDDHGPTVAILATLKENAIDAGSPSDYAEFIAENAATKRLDQIGAFIKKQRTAGRQAEEIAAEVSLQVQEIMASATPLRPVKLSDITQRVVSFSTKARTQDTLPGFTTGLSGLDEMTGLLMGGDFVGVIGALGEGKSAVLAGIGKHIAQQVPILACHNEMSEEQNGARAVAGESGLSVRAVREGAYDITGEQAVIDAQERLTKSKMFLYTDPRMTVRSIKARALQMKRTMGLAAILVDGAKRLKTETRHRDNWERKEEITGALKEMAIEMNVPVIVAFQRTRMARRRDDPLPQLDDADFPSLEHDADIVIGVFREENWLMMNKPNAKAGMEAQDEWEGKLRRARGIGKMIGLKVRSGKPFEQREFKWNGPATRFEDL